MKLGVILGTVREGRHSDKVAKWVVGEASLQEGTQAELVDLKDYPMPFFDETISPRYNPDRKASPAVQKWLDKVAEFDAYVIVTPEYNHSIPGVLKNAIDYLGMEVAGKPFAFVSHGSVGGARAVEHLYTMIAISNAISIPKAVALTMRVSDIFDENGTLTEEVATQPYGPKSASDAMLAELKWYSDALIAAKSKS
jgi:NAD(P)H-dependent FMN reductase